MDDNTPEPEALDDLLVSQVDSPEGGLTVEQRRDVVRAENAVAATYWGGFQPRIVVTFLVFAAAWVWVIVAGVTGAMPLWAGLLVNTVLATTFYMPMHEATHKNIWGRQNRLRALEDVIGVLCSVPTGINFAAHRSSHMRHHAHTNDPGRDPDHFTHGAKGELALKFVGMTLLFSLLPVFALVRPARVLLPAAVRRNLDGDSGSPRDGKAQIRFWLLCTVVLAVSFATGHGAEALFLWWIPARLQLGWLMFIFAWYPHHPATETGRYRHTRVAVFPGSGMLIRGHDHHAMHHLFPRVPHYRLRALWSELAGDMVARGVRTEGRAVGATRPVTW